MLSAENVATPPVALAVLVPRKSAPVVPVDEVMASMTLVVAFITTFP